MAYVSYCPIGVFAYDEKGRLLDKVLFSKDAGKASESLLKCMSEELSAEERVLVDRIKEMIIFERKKKGFEHSFPNIAGNTLRENLEKIALDLKFVKNVQELRDFIYEVNLILSAMKIRESVRADSLIIQAVSAIDELDKNLNLLTMRLREWYSWYHPELSEKIKDNEQFVKAIEKAERKDSLGADLNKEDVDKIKSLAKVVSEAYGERKTLEEYVNVKVKENMPNLEALIGGILAARLIAAAGSLETLAKFPSSTIQIIGAEKALFRHLRGRGKAPKHGLLFSSPYVQKAPQGEKGRVARILASKISLAAKIDFYKGEFIGDKLKEDLEKMIS